ncbi:MAG: sugar phosphate isomerase/epimerase [Bacteroidetes bacterium]|nr:sugar phosphate isomerase/epimerase [Bacteroidota bacterium]
MNRRSFIELSALAATTLILPSVFATENKMKIGLQLYTLRDVINKDVLGTLQQIASFGYQELESYGYTDGKLFGLPIKEVATMTSDLGMKITSGHYGIDLFTDWERAANDAKEIGCSNMVVPSLPQANRQNLDSIKKTCEQMNRQAEVCKKYEIQFGYHNHADEFAVIEGKTVYEWMLSLLDPKLVSMEMDIYWVTYAGQNPLKWFENYSGRFQQWHVKDMSKTDRKRNADLGTGTIDFKAIFAKANLAGLKHFYIEQETYPSSSMESAKVCADNVKKFY